MEKNKKEDFIVNIENLAENFAEERIETLREKLKKEMEEKLKVETRNVPKVIEEYKKWFKHWMEKHPRLIADFAKEDYRLVRLEGNGICGYPMYKEAEELMFSLRRQYLRWVEQDKDKQEQIGPEKRNLVIESGENYNRFFIVHNKTILEKSFDCIGNPRLKVEEFEIFKSIVKNFKDNKKNGEVISTNCQ